MTKRQLIDEIVSLNHSAEPAFLARFQDAELDQYLGRLRVIGLPRPGEQVTEPFIDPADNVEAAWNEAAIETAVAVAEPPHEEHHDEIPDADDEDERADADDQDDQDEPIDRAEQPLPARQGHSLLF